MSTPKIDHRGIEDILVQFREMVPFYTPEWNPQAKDPGWALAEIFAEMFAGVLERLNQVPEKNFIEFLNMLDVKLLPAQQARAPVVFNLSSGAAEPALIPAGTQVAAEKADGGAPVVFKTERNIMATPAKLVKAYFVKPDSIFEAPEDLLSGPGAVRDFKFFTGQNLQEHIIYLGNNDLLQAANRIGIELISVKWNRMFCDPKMVSWEYYGEQETAAGGETVKQEGWYSLEIDLRNTSPEKIVLHKNQLGEIKQKEINGIESRWLRCSVNPLMIDYLKKAALRTLKIAVKPLVVNESLPKTPVSDEGPNILPDLMFANDIPIEIPAEVYPFGRFPRVFDTFYLASSEALSKKNGRITLEFEAAYGPDSIPVGMVQGIGPDFAGQLIRHQIDTLEQLLRRTPEELTGILTITLKDGTEKPITVTKAVNILEAARKEYFDKTGVFRPVTGGSDSSGTADEDLALSWEYWDGAGWQAIKGISDNTDKLRQPGKVEFDCPGDISVTVVNGQENLWIRTRIISGDYGKERFVCPDGKTWQIDTTEVHPPRINLIKIKYASGSVYPEKCFAVNNLNYADITAEVQGSSSSLKPFKPLDDTHYTLYLGFETPPLKGPISVFFALEEQEYREDNRPAFKWEYFREQKETGEWVSLEVLDGTGSFAESGCLEFIGPPDLTCKLMFGRNLYWIRAVDTGDRFKSITPPPAPVLNGIYPNTAWVIQTETGAGEAAGLRGNVGRAEIKGLKTSIAFVDSVFNPEPADGGSDAETLAEAMERGPQMLRHQNRAVTLEDFEWLAGEASRNIARVKCLPNFNDRGEQQSGWVTLVIIPKSTDGRPKPSLRLRQMVERRLREHTANVIAFPRHLRVIGPDYQEISVSAAITAKTIDMVPLVENRVLKELDGMLHPLTGGLDGRGWEFGRLPRLSDFFALLEGIDGVDHVDVLTMVSRSESGQEIRISPNNQTDQEMPEYGPNALVYSGKHVVRVKAKVGGIG
ncbi:baseplate J/gp47 family protein [Phosphitispora fastidiosa]|uniref:baseplate J/gp47 family protein n=1 Tax=Phosphitispora fastidiosa TaxID=2837202 RepID=UPI001E49FB55|nr:baseplate J/gp47 family protein [Phosphitispora fastidiosa]MBU7005767.1 hypothetical protein [Phosphitispora fastidiosa]